jgi:hypothetical protein
LRSPSPPNRARNILLSGKDDCYAADPAFFDPTQSSNADPLGGFATGFRCNEYGHRCGGAAPPRNVTVATPLSGCVSAERPPLASIADMKAFIESFKSNASESLFFAALAGPVEPYVVEPRPDIPTAAGGRETQAAVARSCTSGAVWGEPAVRLNQMASAFGERGVFRSICAADLAASMRHIGERLMETLPPLCLAGDTEAHGAVETRPAEGTEWDLPACDAGLSQLPCWRIVSTPRCPRELEVCRAPSCAPAPAPRGVVPVIAITL